MTKARPGMRITLSEHYARYGHPFTVGFDPSSSDLHPFLQRLYQSEPRESFLVQWYHAVLDGIGPTCGSIKFQSAFFEAAGLDGQVALRTVIKDAKRRGLYVILDAKRGDIASTMQAYGTAAFEDIGADALTILPWMGVDVLEALLPWMKRGHGVYTVWLSSNVAGRTIQTLEDKSQITLAETMYHLWEQSAAKHDVTANCGYVLGATDVPSWSVGILAERSQCLLMPGIGAQGGKITSALKKLIDEHPASLLPISRGILAPEKNTAINSWQDYSDGVQNRWNGFMQEWARV